MWKPVLIFCGREKPSFLVEVKENTDNFADLNFDELTVKQKKSMITTLTEQMEQAAKKLDFEEAATLRDAIMELQNAVKKPIKKKGKTLNGKR